jgi:hypothetical protein
MKLADQIYCTFGGGGGDTASSTAPVGGHPEPDGTVGRNKMRKGGPDKGGVAAQKVSQDTAEFIKVTKPQLFSGGAGSGCKGPNCGRKASSWAEHRKEFVSVLKKHGLEHNLAPGSQKDFYQQGGTASAKPGGQVHIYGDGSWVHHGAKHWSGRRGTLPQDLGRGSGAAELDAHLSKVSGGIKSASKTKTSLTKTAMRGTSGGQSEGSSKTALKFYVVDGQGRILHTYRTREEAEHASAGNRYTKVVTHVEQATPLEETPEVRDMIRKRPGDTQVRVFRRSLPYPSPLPGGPQK